MDAGANGAVSRGDGAGSRIPGLSRRTLLTGAAAAFGGVALGPTLWARPARAAVPIQGVHLGYGSNAAHGLAVSWATETRVPGCVLEIGLDDTYGLTIRTEERRAGSHATSYHHATVDELDPGTLYRYRIRHDGGGVAVGAFRTAPKAPGPFRFATFGDMGVSAESAMIVDQLTRLAPDFCFVVGDLCYADKSGGSSNPVTASLPNDPKVWDDWLRQIQPSAAVAPWMTTVGNHEIERDAGELGYDGYLARFTMPDNGASRGDVTYSFEYGNVGFIALDGNDASFQISANQGYLGAQQDDWLRKVVAGFRRDPKIDFIVAGFHNCMYCSNVFSGSDGGNRGRWRQILEDAEVDLVVNGHNHCYERTHPLRDGDPVVEVSSGGAYDSAAGTTYLTVGGAGQIMYPTSGYPVGTVWEQGDGGAAERVPESTHWSASRFMLQSFAVIDVVPPDATGTTRMVVRAMTKEGLVVDSATLCRQHRAVKATGGFTGGPPVQD